MLQIIAEVFKFIPITCMCSCLFCVLSKNQQQHKLKNKTKSIFECLDNTYVHNTYKNILFQLNKYKYFCFVFFVQPVNSKFDSFLFS